MGLILLCASVSSLAAEFSSAPNISASEGLPYLYAVTALGTGNVVITAPNGLPPWLALEQSGNGTATLAGTPDRTAANQDGGQAEIVLRAEDSACRIFPVFCTDFQVFTITIASNSAPILEGGDIPDQQAREGEPFRLDLAGAFADPDGDSLTLSVSGLPPSLTLEGRVIAGTPTARDVRAPPYVIEVVADDQRGGTGSAQFGLVILPLERADLVLTSLTAQPAPATRGAPIAFVTVVENRGPEPAAGGELAVELAGTPLVLQSGTCTPRSGSDDTWACPIPPLPNKGTATIEIVASAALAGDLHVRATAYGTTADPDRSNDDDALSVNIGESIAVDAAQTLPADPPTLLGAGDFDGDGFDDLVMGVADGVLLYLNVDDPHALHADLKSPRDQRRGLASMPLTLIEGVGARAIASADYDNDGDLDLAVAVEDGAPVVLFTNLGAAALERHGTLSDASRDASAIGIGDLDGDGLLDIVVATPTGAAIYMNTGGGSFSERAAPPAATGARTLLLADLGGSALPDLGIITADGAVLVLEALGQVTFADPIKLDPGPVVAAATSDFDGDGLLDVALARMQAPPGRHAPSNPVYLRQTGGGWLLVTELGASPTASLAAADVNYDGRSDLLASNATGAHRVYLGRGDGSFDLHPVLITSGDSGPAVLGAFGRAGLVDLALPGRDGTYVFFNDGHGQLGLGDLTRPVINLLGPAEVVIEVESLYDDAGAIAIDEWDGEVGVHADVPVDSAVIGHYTVTYTAIDAAGNAAEPVTRSVQVAPRTATGGGGGGVIAPLVPLALVLLVAARAMRRTAFPNSTTTR